MPGLGCCGSPLLSRMVKAGGVFGTSIYPHLILPYSAYYGQLASHYGGHWRSHIPWWCDLKHSQVPETPIHVKMRGLPVLSVLTIGNPHTKPPPYDFLNLYGASLQAPRTPKMKYFPLSRKFISFAFIYIYRRAFVITLSNIVPKTSK